MKPLTLLLLLLATLVSASHATVNDALSFAYEGATPYVKQGFTFREDAWGGDLGIGDKKAVRTQLFKGNSYWFIVGTDVKNAVVTVHVYDPKGQLTEAEFWHRGRYCGVLVEPKQTGAYWAIVTVEKSPSERTRWALVYGFR